MKPQTEEKIILLKAQIITRRAELRNLEQEVKDLENEVQNLPTQQEEDEKKTYSYAVTNGKNKGLYDNYLKIPKKEVQKAIQVCTSESMMGMQLRPFGKYVPMSARQATIGSALARTTATPTIDEWNEVLSMVRKGNNHFLPKEKDDWISKAIVMPGADPLNTEKVFYCGLVEIIYPGPDLPEIKFLGHKFVQGIINYTQRLKITPERGFYMKILSTIPDWDEPGRLFPAYHLIQLGPCSQRYQPAPSQSRGPQQMTDEEIVELRADVTQMMLDELEKMISRGRIKVNYEDAHILVVSYQTKESAERDKEALKRWSDKFANADIKLSKRTVTKLQDKAEETCPPEHGTSKSF